MAVCNGAKADVHGSQRHDCEPAFSRVAALATVVPTDMLGSIIAAHLLIHLALSKEGACLSVIEPCVDE